MAYPVQYIKDTLFKIYAGLHPEQKINPVSLDKEFDAIQVALGQTQAAINGVTRDDGKLKNNIITPEMLDNGTLMLIANKYGTARGAWATGALYNQADIATRNGATYVCLVQHLSSSDFNFDENAGYWQMIANNALTGFPNFADVFNGNNSQTDFTLSYTLNSSFEAFAFINGLAKIPGIDYTVTTNVIHFVAAPPTGTNNVVVITNGASGSAASSAAAAAASAAAAAQSALDATSNGAAQVALAAAQVDLAEAQVAIAAGHASAADASADAAAASAVAADASADAAAASAASVTPINDQTHAAASKTTPVDADEIPITDSAGSWALKKLTWVNIKATLKTYFDTLYAAAGASSEITGVVKDYIGNSAPSGYVFLSGRTIGDASSGATERANADTSALFTLLWDSMANTEAAVSGGRGASAAADFAAHKTITLPDARGRVIAGKDNMGGTTASRLTSAGAGITGTTLGVAGGTETHTLTSAQMPNHYHQLFIGTTGSGAPLFGNPDGGAFSPAGATLSAGSGNAHQNTQPTLVLNKIIKL